MDEQEEKTEFYLLSSYQGPLPSPPSPVSWDRQALPGDTEGRQSKREQRLRAILKREKTYPQASGPPGQLEENDPVLLVMVALDRFPCVRIFPGMEHWTA